MRGLLVRYLIPRDLDASVRRHERIGTPLVRKLLMGTIGRPSRLGNSGYRLDRNRAPLEAVTDFAANVSAEVIHIVTAFYWAGIVVAEALAGQFGPTIVIGVVAGLVDVALVALQRYNRARLLRAADLLLARGQGYRSGYRNWIGLDQRALRDYHTQAPTAPAQAARRGNRYRADVDLSGHEHAEAAGPPVADVRVGGYDGEVGSPQETVSNRSTLVAEHVTLDITVLTAVLVSMFSLWGSSNPAVCTRWPTPLRSRAWPVWGWRFRRCLSGF